MFEINVGISSPAERARAKREAEIDELMNVYVMDYDNDNYHKFSDEPTTEEEKAVRKLRNRYRNVPDFVEAKRIYNEYMQMIYDIYGDKETFKKYYKLGLVDYYIPNKPKLKNNKELKELYKHCPTVGKISKKIINNEVYDEYMREVYPELSITEPSTDKDDYPWINWDTEPEPKEMVPISKIERNKEAEKIIDKYKHVAKPTKFSKKNVGSNYLSFSTDVDLISLGFALKNPKKFKRSKGKFVDDKDFLTITDIMDAEPGEIIFEDDIEIKPTSVFNVSEEASQIEMYAKLAELGWDAYGLMKNQGSFNRRTLDKFNPKKIKRRKKKEKKAYKKAKKMQGNFLDDAVFGNGMSIDDFEAFSREMLSMTSKTVFEK